MTIDIVKVILPTVLSFMIGIAITPVVTHYLYKYKAWKKRGVFVSTDGRDAPISRRLHNDENIKTPKMGGIVVWASVFITTIFVSIISALNNGDVLENLSFFSREQTWLPLFALAVGAVVGLLDDYLEVLEKHDQLAGGLSSTKRLITVFFVGLVGAWWFYSKLGISSVYMPFIGNLDIGIWFVPLFIFVILGVYSGGVIDGIDGLSGGVFASIFSAYGIIAFIQQQFDISALCFAIVGGVLAFLWFNIPPARFYLSETGTMALTMTIGVIAFMTNQILVLPIIAFPLLAASLSSSIQLLSKRFRNGKKVFLVAPIHHHFEAIGWPSYKVVMRFWVLSVIFASVGTVVALIG